MTQASGNSSNNTDKDWVPVEEGLFEYPVGSGKPPALLGNRCTSCGKRFFPKRNLCPTCVDQGELEDIALDHTGVVYACTVVNIPSPAGIQEPYAYGYVDIPADNIRVFGLFTEADPFSFHSGQRVELVLEALKENEKGQKVIGYKFKPAEEGR